MAAMQQDWDIFCRVIDNFGDIGVCWRLARQLANEHGIAVRLWVDELASLQPLCPEVDPLLPGQTCQGVRVCRWSTDFAVDRVADVVIEAFACELPSAYIAAMATKNPQPCWINLEYLTAESWAEDCHGLASPHPALPLQKYFFFPGYSEKTGGLLRERDLLTLHDHDAPPATTGELAISLFCYETAPVGALLDAIAASPQPAVCYVPPGKPLQAVKQHLGGDGPWQLGSSRIEPIPFLALDDYDRLLWRCDVNFVRGEDSLVRAQWAGKPFVWQVYRQDEDAHLVKLAAFLDRCCPEGGAWRRINEAWNTGDGVAEAWTDFLAQRTEIAGRSRAWRERLARHPDLATALANFCAGRV